ncbi:hypothetical protein CFOL_v3_33577 [Cephalotus follicularis]|uniref:GIL1/IRKI C-terminal domain-containing protein n=1 Tax=Cephalotus follicularis TaxID=3775 RepID=A0A1Q3DD37_CEPFO|nr:hypothetical protein CFOL_v3_33577 [Cephalotus follicularis]
MASSSSSSPSTSELSPTSPPPPPHQPSQFAPIEECERGEQEEAYSSYINKRSATPKHLPPTTPRDKNSKANAKKRHESAVNSSDDGGKDGSISCNKCRPHLRDKFSVVPLDNNGLMNKFMASPNGIFKSIFQSFARKSPKPTDISIGGEEQWKIAAAELSHKLTQATRKRDEALLEASRLKYSMADLEKKLNKLEVYCHNLKSGLDECSGNSPYRIGKGRINSQQMKNQESGFSVNDKLIEQFLVCVSEARSSVRHLSRSLTTLLRHMGGKVFDRLSVLFEPYDIKVSYSKNSKGLLFYLEALLNKAFFEDFESVGFQKNAINQILNPIDRCESNYASFNVMQCLTWDEVLNKGTRHFSEEFSKFCDRKMSEIVAMLGWNRAWPEPLLQSFFGASKSVWLIHLLANSFHPGLPIFRVDKGVAFDAVYMEDMSGDRAKKLVPTTVRIMVAPGFYVYGNVVKCKVLCRYNSSISNEKGSTPSP